MMKWIKARIDILKITLPNPILLGLLGFLQTARILLVFAPSSLSEASLGGGLSLIPWYVWVIAWLLLFWGGALEYSLGHKEKLDKTSHNFFAGFLDYLIQEGRQLFRRSTDGDFYNRIHEWRRMVIQGIAIGLGPEASEKFFHQVDSQYSLTRAYKECQSSRSPDALCRALEGTLGELELIRGELKPEKRHGREEMEAGNKSDFTAPPNPQLPPGRNN